MGVKQDGAPAPNSTSMIAKAALLALQAALQTLYGSDVPAILVYGSHARRQAHPSSDIDVLLLYANPVQRGREIRRISHTLADLNLRYGVVISVLPATQAEYAHPSSPFWMNVRREGVGLDAL